MEKWTITGSLSVIVILCVIDDIAQLSYAEQLQPRSAADKDDRMVDVNPGAMMDRSSAAGVGNDTSAEESQLRQLTDIDTSAPAGRRDKKQSATPRERGESRRRTGSRRKSPERQGRRRSRNRQGKGAKYREKSRGRDNNNDNNNNNYNRFYADGLRYRSHQADASANVMGVNNEVTDVKNMSRVTSPPKPATDCKQLMCNFGGKCVKDELRAGVRCQCPLGTTGKTCEKELTIRHPKFDGTGYMAFPVLRGAYKEFSLTVEFRPDTKNGLIVFSGERPSATTDFFSISLVNGFAEFRFDCGTGPAQLRTVNPVNLREWNTITIYRDEWNGLLQLNNGEEVSGRSKGLYSRITFREGLYIGGYRNISAAANRIGTRWGMIGCIRKLEINDKEYDMRKGAFVGDAINGMDVGECSANVCDALRCLNGGRCAAGSADEGICQCPLGTTGDTCQSRDDINIPSFNGNSYLQYIGLQRRVLSHTKIEMTFKPSAPDGMILYNGYSSDGTGDFISIAMFRGRVEFRFDLGTGPAIIRNDRMLALNEWHTIKITRTGRTGHLQVDNETAKEGISRGAFTQLTLTLDMFVGGHRNFDETARKAGVSEAFKGCVQKLTINDKEVKLIGEALSGVNVDNCPHPCANNPCYNGGLCVPIKDMYKCSCPLGFENTNCEDHASPELQLPKFAGDSYLRFSSSNVDRRVSGQKFDIQLSFRTNASDGLLFWVGKEDMTVFSDYLALGMHKGRIQFTFNLGDGEAVIKYNKRRLDDGKWHRVRARRYGRIGYLEVDQRDIVEGTAPGTLMNLESENTVYLGGVEDIYRKTHRKFSRGFSGCITNVTLGTDYNLSLDFNDPTTTGWNVRECATS